MKLNKVAGATSEIWQVFIRDSSSTTGAGLAALAYNTGSLTAYYHRDTDTTATAITLADMTVGTFTSSGFKKIDDANMPGWYQFCPPNAALASGAKSCAFLLKGAANMVPVPIEVQLTAVNPDSATAFITGINSLAPPANWNLTSIDSSGRQDVIKIAGTTQTARDLGASVLLSSGTGAGQLSLLSGIAKADVETIKTQAITCAAGITVLASVGTAATSTAQTGDNYARLGTPAGASISADMAAVKSDTGSAKTVTDALTAASAAKLATTAGEMYAGTVDTGSFAATVTEFESDDITTAAADHWNGRVIIFTSGTLKGQATSIDDYAKVGANGHFTVVALTAAPANNVTFIII